MREKGLAGEHGLVSKVGGNCQNERKSNIYEEIAKNVTISSLII